MNVKDFLDLTGKSIDSKVIILEGSHELYNNYLNQKQVYRYIEILDIKSIYASKFNIVIYYFPSFITFLFC